MADKDLEKISISTMAATPTDITHGPLQEGAVGTAATHLGGAVEDLIRRLRFNAQDPGFNTSNRDLCREAADALDKLRSERDAVVPANPRPERSVWEIIDAWRVKWPDADSIPLSQFE